MEQLPFDNESFDVVTIAGSLSYGDSGKVDSEIRRVLKSGGYFICVDSLNNNPIYKLNRYFHYLKKERSLLTLKNMPTIQRINSIKNHYSDIYVEYFGCISWLMPIVKLFFNENRAKDISDAVDRYLKINRSAFKFVLIAKT